MPTTALASAGTLTATEIPETAWTPTTYECSRKMAKNSLEQRKFVKKDTKRAKIGHF
jgi:hypothetical protein